MASKIVYRVVTALLALCAFPVAIFSPIVHVVGEVSITDSYVYDDLSLWRVYTMFFGKDSTFSGFAEGARLAENVQAVIPKLITSGCCLAAALLLALAIAVVAACSNRKLVHIILAFAAVGSVIAMFVVFNDGFAKPFTDGTIAVSDLGLVEWGIINSLLDAFVSVKVLQITSAGFLLVFVFAAVLMWTLAFMLTEWGEPKKDVKKGMGQKR